MSSKKEVEKMKSKIRMNKIPIQEFRKFMREELRPIMDKLSELAITYEDWDTNKRFREANSILATLQSEIWYQTRG